jgi:hypothetical protein
MEDNFDVKIMCSKFKEKYFRDIAPACSTCFKMF